MDTDMVIALHTVPQFHILVTPTTRSRMDRVLVTVNLPEHGAEHSQDVPVSFIPVEDDMF